MKKASILILLFALTLAAVSPAYGSSERTDIASSYAKEEIKALIEAGIINGNADGNFNPKDAITRAEFAKILAQLLDLEEDATAASKFTDVPEWALGYVGALVSAGITKGTGENRFGSNENISRQELAVFFIRSWGLEEVAREADLEPKFSDAEKIAAWAKAQIALAGEIGFMKGNPNGDFNPTGNAEQQAVARLAYEFSQHSDEYLERVEQVLHPSEPPNQTEQEEPKPADKPETNSGQAPATDRGSSEPNEPSSPSEPSEPGNPPTPQPAITKHELKNTSENQVTLTVYAQNAESIYWVLPQSTIIEPAVHPQPIHIYNGQDYDPDTKEWISATISGHTAVSASGNSATIELNTEFLIDRIWVVAARGSDSSNPRLSGVYIVQIPEMPEPVQPGPGEPKPYIAKFDDNLEAIVDGIVDGIPFKLEITGSLDDEARSETPFRVQKIEKTNTLHALKILDLDGRIARITLGIPSELADGESSLFHLWDGVWKYRGGYANNRMIRGTPAMLSESFSIAVAAKVPTPQNFKATGIISDSVTLTWDPVEGATGYIIIRTEDDSSNRSEFFSQNTTYEDKNLVAGKAYTYEIFARIHEFESSVSNQIVVIAESETTEQE